RIAIGRRNEACAGSFIARSCMTRLKSRSACSRGVPVRGGARPGASPIGPRVPALAGPAIGGDPGSPRYAATARTTTRTPSTAARDPNRIVARFDVALEDASRAAAPHWTQYRAPGTSAAWQDLQCAPSRGAPHAGQYEPDDSVPQSGHFMW